MAFTEREKWLAAEKFQNLEKQASRPNFKRKGSNRIAGLSFCHIWISFNGFYGWSESLLKWKPNSGSEAIHIENVPKKIAI